MKPSTTIALLCAALVQMAAPAAAGPDGRDLHAYWDGRCKDCHGDSAAFARSTLRVDQGQLAGRHHGADLTRFLHNHYLADELVAPVTAIWNIVLAATAQPPTSRARHWCCAAAC